MTHSPPLARTARLAAFGAFVAAAGAVLAYAHAPDLVLSMEIDSPLVRGLYPAELTPDERVSFAWTHDQMTLALPGLDRRRPWTVDIRSRGSRANEEDLPTVAVAIDGIQRAQWRSTNRSDEHAVELPPDPTGRRGARVQLRVSDTIVPGPHDPRALGIVIDEIRMRHTGGGFALVPTGVLQGAAIAGAIYGAMVSLIGLRGVRALTTIGLVCVGQAMLLVNGAAPYTTFATGTAPAIAGGVAIGTLLAALVARAWAGAPLRRTAQGVLAVSGGVLLLKLLLLLHPNLPIGDGLFQAHRFEWTRAGRWLFTSITPGEYPFPYAIALYLFALPFSWLLPTTAGSLGLMALLRVIVATMDVIAGAMVYPAIVRRVPDARGPHAESIARHDRLAGALAVGLFHAVPLNLIVQTTGNLTNAFGQSLFVMAIAGLLIGWLRPAAYGRLALLTALMAAAMLSHTSTFAIAVPAFLLIAIVYRWRGLPEVEALARPLALSAIVAALVSIALYYAYFTDTYAAIWTRVSAELAMPADAASPGRRPVAQHVAALPHYLTTYFGWPVLALAAVGVGTGVFRRRDALPLTLAGWLLTTIAFLILGIVTPVDMRHYLAAFPAIAVLGALGAARGWRAGPFAQAAIIVLLLAAALAGARHGWEALR